MGREIERLIEAALWDRERRGGFDLESLEFLTREVMHRCGALILKKLLAHEDGSCLGRECDCGGGYLDKKHEEKTIRTCLGEIRVKRTIQRCNGCGAWRVPEDMVLDVVGTGFSPGLRRLMAKVGAEVCFDKGRDFLFELGGVRVTDKEVERVSESLGAEISCREDERTGLALQGGGEDWAESVDTLYSFSTV